MDGRRRCRAGLADSRQQLRALSVAQDIQPADAAIWRVLQCIDDSMQRRLQIPHQAIGRDRQRALHHHFDGLAIVFHHQ
jgi:hypothetical protein